MAMSAQDRVAAVAAQGEVVTSEDELAAMDAPALRNFIRSRDACMSSLWIIVDYFVVCLLPE